MVVGQLPEAKLAVVPLIVEAATGFRVSDPSDRADLPSGEFQSSPVMFADVFVDQDQEVSRRTGSSDASRQRNGSADVFVG